MKRKAMCGGKGNTDGKGNKVIGRRKATSKGEMRDIRKGKEQPLAKEM